MDLMNRNRNALSIILLYTIISIRSNFELTLIGCVLCTADCIESFETMKPLNNLTTTLKFSKYEKKDRNLKSASKIPGQVRQRKNINLTEFAK